MAGVLATQVRAICKALVGESLQRSLDWNVTVMCAGTIPAGREHVMSRLSLITVACLLLAQGAVFARPVHHPRRAARARHVALGNSAVNRVPLGVTSGVSGSANSANPAPNVSPLQTPQDPLRTPRL